MNSRLDMDEFGLPQSLGGGLLLRWATEADTEALAEFNFLLHNDNPGGFPEVWIKEWTMILMDGHHPITRPQDITVVVDQNAGNKIVSTVALISQTWSYGGISFGCGRPELIATDSNYRRRGLVKAQMQAIHARSASKGELLQAITGIPWYYRQFGYEMALDLDAWRFLEFHRIQKLPLGSEEQYRIRPARDEDLPFLSDLYEQQCRSSLVACLRNQAIWRYELARHHSGAKNLQVVESVAGQPVAYADITSFPGPNTVREIVVDQDVSWRAVCLFIARTLKDRCLSAPEEEKRDVYGLTFSLGISHPAYDALGDSLGKLRETYAWYLRLPDLPAFLTRIRPVLASRLAGSVMAGHSGTLRLSFYRQHLAVDFDQGLLSTVQPYEPRHFFDADAFFPDGTFLQLLFGFRSLDEVKYARPDCIINNEQSAVLLKCLFPRKPSFVVPLS